MDHKRTYRLRSVHIWTALVCMAIAGPLAAYSAWLFLYEGYSATTFALGEALWLGFFGLGLWQLLSARKSWLERDGSALVRHGLGGTSRLDLKAAQVRWSLFPRGGRIALECDAVKTSVVLDNYPTTDRTELINWIVDTVPQARAATTGWEAFRARYASWRAPEKSASPEGNDR